MNQLNRQVWQQFLSSAKPYWFSEAKAKARTFLGILLVLMLMVNGLNVVINYVGGDFMTALSGKNAPKFYQMLFIYGSVFVVGTPIVVFYSWVQDKLGLEWRKWLTASILDKYFRNRSYYRVSFYTGIDNPDERIAQDVSAFTKGALSFLLVVLSSIITLFSFAAILWSINTTLVLVLFVYSICGTVATVWLGKRLIGLNFNQLRKEADFRFSLIHVRNNVESIAFYQGEEQEKGTVKKRLQDALSNFNVLIGWQRNLNFLTTGYNYFVVIIPSLVIAPLYFAGKVKFGMITQADLAFSQVLTALSIIVTQFSDLSSFIAVINRLGIFSESLETTDEKTKALPVEFVTTNESTPGDVTREVKAKLKVSDSRELKAPESVELKVPETATRRSSDSEAPAPRKQPSTDETIDSTSGDSVRLNQVTVMTPDRQLTLVRDLSVACESGKGLLIMGPSGAGKSSILRAIAGLWKSGDGEIVRPDLSEMLFLPQHPYMILGSLRSQVLYPSKQAVDDERLYEVLKQVNLAELPERFGGLDADLNWSLVLSLGEQQRLAFARLLINAPRYAILDEATSALDEKNEANLYRLLKQSDTTFISVGHRSSLFNYHDNVLELRGDSQWQVVPVGEMKKNEVTQSPSLNTKQAA